MKRSHRVGLAAGVASALVAGATCVVALGPLDVGAAATPPAGSSPSASQTDLTALHEAISRLSTEATALQADLAATQQRAGTAATRAAGAAAIPRSDGPGGTSVAPSLSARRPAPTVHTRTGASTATGHEQEEGEDD